MVLTARKHGKAMLPNMSMATTGGGRGAQGSGAQGSITGRSVFTNPSAPTFTQHHHYAHNQRRGVEPMGQILNRFSDQQKKDVSMLSSGHLNPNNANSRLEKYREKNKPGIMFGASDGGHTAGAMSSNSKEDTGSTNTAVRSNRQKQGANAGRPTIGVNVNQAALSKQELPGLGVDSMIDLLSKFDSVKLREKVVESPVAAAAVVRTNTSTDGDIDTDVKPDDEKSPQRAVRKFLPSYQLNLTKTEQFKTLQLIDKSVIRRDHNYLRNANAGKRDRLQQYRDWLDRELVNNNCPSQGPDINRLKVYSECFEQLINEFRSYAPLLAEIKNEYDRTVLSFQSDQNELNFLRTKVQKLLSQNENRMLLKFERKKAKELEIQVNALHSENQRLKADLRRKLAIYASYLPASLLHEKKKEDPLLTEIESQIHTYAIGEDPLSVSERHMQILKAEIQAKEEEVETLKEVQDREFVPRITKEKIEEALQDVEEKLRRIVDKNNGLEQQLMGKQGEIRQLETTLREKEQQYQFLITEYNELSEAVASSYNKHVPVTIREHNNTTTTTNAGTAATADQADRSDAVSSKNNVAIDRILANAMGSRDLVNEPEQEQAVTNTIPSVQNHTSIDRVNKLTLAQMEMSVASGDIGTSVSLSHVAYMSSTLTGSAITEGDAPSDHETRSKLFTAETTGSGILGAVSTPSTGESRSNLDTPGSMLGDAGVGTDASVQPTVTDDAVQKYVFEPSAMAGSQHNDAPASLVPKKDPDSNKL